MTEPDKLALYDGILAYDMSRLTRGNDAETSAIETWAREHGKVLVLAIGARYPCEGNEGIRWDIEKRVSHQAWLDASERYTRMQDYLRASGRLVGRPPFAYLAVPHPDGHRTLAVDEDLRAYALGIFERVAGGRSLAQVRNWLDAERVNPPDARQPCRQEGRGTAGSDETRWSGTRR